MNYCRRIANFRFRGAVGIKADPEGRIRETLKICEGQLWLMQPPTARIRHLSFRAEGPGRPSDGTPVLHTLQFSSEATLH